MTIRRVTNIFRLFLLLSILALMVGCGGGSSGGDAKGGSPSSNADLASLTLSSGTLSPSFDASTLSYATMIIGQSSITLTPTAEDSGATIQVNGADAASGQASSPITLDPGENIITVVVTAEDGTTTKTYTVTAGYLPQEAYAKASNAEAGDSCGYSISLSGDTLAVGAFYEDSSAAGGENDDSAQDSGAVYVFTRSGTTWTQQAFIKASNAEAADYFGYSIALSGDTLAVGACGEDSSLAGGENNNSAPDSGAVYVFTRSGTTWTQQAFLKASNTGAFDYFGVSVALSGDTLAVGANGEASSLAGGENDNSTLMSGAVYVFTRSGTTWTQQAFLKASNAEEGDSFGYSVSLSGDTLAVGAFYEDDSAQDSGAVYVFTRSGTTWTQQAFLKASNAGAGDSFGYSVSLSGDTLVVGAYSEDSSLAGGESDNSAQDSGAVYIFTRSGTTWTQQAFLKASNAEAGDGFGYSVSLSGDTLAVGANIEDSSLTGGENDNSAPDSGAVYVFTRSGTTWTQQAFLKASNAETTDYFGYSIALSGDTLVVGAYGEDSSAAGGENDDSAPDSGAVYILRW